MEKDKQPEGAQKAWPRVANTSDVAVIAKRLGIEVSEGANGYPSPSLQQFMVQRERERAERRAGEGAETCEHRHSSAFHRSLGTRALNEQEEI